MRIRQHFWVLGKCVFCGAPEWARVVKFHEQQGQLDKLPATDARECVWREGGIGQRYLRPEPKRRERACEDRETIASRILAIRAEAAPRCPLSPQKKLYDCLREIAHCPAECRYVGEWVGPQSETTTG